jgi:hypothetical protein
MTRCPAALWLRAHDVRWRQPRDAAGRVVRPHALVWTCQRCGRDVAETRIGQVEARPRDTGEQSLVRRQASWREPTRPHLVARGAQTRARRG